MCNVEITIKSRAHIRFNIANPVFKAGDPNDIIAQAINIVAHTIHCCEKFTSLITQQLLKYRYECKYIVYMVNLVFEFAHTTNYRYS